MMKRRFVQGLLILALLCGAVLLTHPTAAWALTGTDTQAEPYQISSAADLQAFAKLVNDGNTTACAVLMGDITINEKVLDEDGNLISDTGALTQWTPIGNGSKPYTGTFDGAGHTISGLYINSDAKYVGLFGCIGKGGTVKNLTLADSSINSSRSSGDYAYVGGICGQNYKGSITNCHNSGAVTGSSGYVGGICGDSGGSITSCSNSGDVSGSGFSSDVGGICGFNDDSIENCSNSGDVTGISDVGGICGRNDSRIESCSNSGDVTGSGSDVGGICGHNDGSITTCSNSDPVTGSGDYVGGICGYSDNSHITACYWLSGTADAGIGVGMGGGEATEKTAEQYASGEVAWLLNQWQEDGPWRQNLTGTNRDAFPTLDQTHHIVIYDGKNYTNDEHKYQNGFCTICGSYEPATQDDAGTYQISNAGQLYWFAELVNGTLTDGTAKNTAACAVLTTDITINEKVLDEDGNLISDTGALTQWTPIGSNDNNCYTGTFDGAGHTISGLYIDSDAEYVGLFDYIGEGGTVKNLALADSAIRISRSESNTFVGGICGDNLGSITNCHNSGIVNVNGGASTYVGGICGRNWNKGSIESCSNSGAVGGGSNVGGICGWNYDGSITSCSNSGAVGGGSGFSSTVGGICGKNSNDGSIMTSSNSGAVGGSGTDIGGLCGFNESGSIENCSNSGTVTGSGSNVGGICGYNSFEGSITNCYWLSGTARAGIGVGVGGGEAIKKNAEDYASGEVAWLLNQWQGNAEVDGKVWAVGKDGYPVLNGKNDNIVVKLTFDTNTGKEEEQPIIRYGNVGDALPKVTLPEITGCTFSGWYDNEALSGDPVTTISANATGDQTYWAKWTAETYRVKLNTNGGTINSGNITSYTYGTGATLPTDVTRSGYTFGGWYDNEALSGDPVTAISANATGDQTYWAKWTAKQTPPPTIPPTVSEETIDAIADAEPGETVTVDLSSGDTTLDKEVFETLAGKDVTLVVDLGDGVSWTVNGTDIPEDTDFTDLDLGVTMNSDGIPVDIINAITGEHGSVQVELAHNGAFGFTMTLTAPLGAENAGLWANLYHFKVNDGEAGREGPLGDNEEAGEMTFETAAEIGDDGSVSLAFSHASQYAIVIDDHNHGVVTLPFTDVSEGDWFYNPVCFVFEKGLMTGTSATTFEPNTSLSRAMLVAVLHRLEGSPAASGGDFTDVSGSDWYATAVNWAAASGITSGTGDGNFSPNTAITREQLAAILMNYAACIGQDVSNRADLGNYTDQPSTWAQEAMSWAVAEGLISGVTADTLQPQGAATRAQVAAILQRFLSE